MWLLYRNEIGKACDFTVSIVGHTFQGIISQIYLFVL